MNVVRAETVAQARSMLHLLEGHWPGAADRLRANALAELDACPDVQVVQVPDTAIESRCSVAGGYLHSTVPPTLTVTESLSQRRRHFTALHELGHHLQKTDARLALTVRQQPADREMFEDAACDMFASLVLIPDDLVLPRSDGRSPTAGDVVELFERTQASRAACCVRIADQLGTHGVVAVLDDMGTVSFAVAHGDVYPPARSASQADTPLVQAALHGHTGAQVDNTYVRYRNGSTSVQLYGDAAWIGDYLITVVVRDRPGWKAFAPPRTETPGFVSRMEVCEVCDEEFLPAAICPSCGDPRCPSGHCTCTLAAERQCDRCFLTLHPSQFDTPTTRVCKECSQ